MRLNGASQPHGAFIISINNESSNGAKFRDKIAHKNRKSTRQNSNITNNSNSNNSSNYYSNSSSSHFCNSSKNFTLKSISKNHHHRHHHLQTLSTAKMSRALKSINFYMLFTFLCFLYVFCLQPIYVLGDDPAAETSFSFTPGLDMTTPEFDYASRGTKKFGDKCESTLECGFPGSICDAKKKSCQCTDDLPITNHVDKCGKESAINETCFFNEQCEAFHFQTECRDGKCVCRFELSPIWNKDGNFECKGIKEKRVPERYIDPAMIGVLVGMALMFIIICVVLRLFSKARWRENRTIFNTPNPRLMNVSLLRDSKLLHGQERRGSRMSVRAPSRQPSMASLRPHSPNPSLGKAGSKPGSRGSSSLSIRSNRSDKQEKQNSTQQQQNSAQQQPLITNITSNPAAIAESITVEITDITKA